MSLQHRQAIGTVAYMGGVMAVPEPFCFDWANMLQFSNEALCKDGQFVHADRTTKSFHAVARNELVSRMNGDWLLMYDTDLQFDADTTARLVQHMYRHDLDVVTGLYVYKGGMVKLPVIHMWDEAGKPGGIVADWDRTEELFSFSSAGAGCLLVRRRVFQRILSELREQPFSIIHPYTEDHSFFKRLRMLDITPYCAWKVECGHLRYEAEHLNPADRIRGVYELREFNVRSIGNSLRT